MLNLKNSLLVGASLSTFTLISGAAMAQQAQGGNTNETVIVTGTRVQGMTAADSAAPITVLGTDALTHGSGSADLRQQLGNTVPSFTAQQYGSDTANLTLTAALRNLSPNDTLVLVNGKRRHYSGNLHVDGGFGSGSASPDISLIPSGAIDHVEVLLDGAAAQYGTDAIAGVVNIILKKKSSGGTLSATAGDYYDRGHYADNQPGGLRGNKANGNKYDVSFNMGLPLFDKGFINFTVDKQYQDFTQYAGADQRYVDNNNVPVAQSTVTGFGTTSTGGVPNGTGGTVGAVSTPNGVANLSTLGNAIPNTFLPNVTGYPRANLIQGNPEINATNAEFNAEYDFSDGFSVYAFGTIGHKFGKSAENDRLPNQIIATIGSDQPCSVTNPDGYNTGSSTSNGLTPSCTGPYTLSGSTAPGTASAGLNGRGLVISGGNAGNLFSTTLINATTGAALPSPTGAGTLSTVPELVLYPSGFQPMEVLKEDDYQYNAGTKFNVMGWDLDASVGYGKDIDNIYNYNTGNRAQFIDTHTTQTQFFIGSFTASQFTGTLDASKPFNIGWASPLTVALGVEAREDLYGIGQGDPGSNYKDGPQAFPGYPASVSRNHSRKNYAVYVDFAGAPIEALQIDVAGRAEHYTDFGDTQIGKITARYDFSPMIAIRGTVSTGFRAPTLSEEFYTAVNVSPTSANLQLPADSSGAQLLGLQNLKPEISTSFSAGIVAHPLDDLSITLDAYSIAVGNRIVSSGTVNATGTSGVTSPLVTQAIALAGVALDPTAASQGVTAFINAESTKTQGIDLVMNYPTDLGDYGLVNWTFAANYNTTHVQHFAPPSSVLLASSPNATFFDNFSVFGAQHGVNTIARLTADWSLDEWGVTLRENYYGPSKGYSSPGTQEEILTETADTLITDLEVRYAVTDQLTLAIGANNLFNHTGEVNPAAPACTGVLGGTIPAGGIGGPGSAIAVKPGGSCTLGPNSTNGEVKPLGGGNVYQTIRSNNYDPNGGYYYGRVTFNF